MIRDMSLPPDFCFKSYIAFLDTENSIKIIPLKSNITRLIIKICRIFFKAKEELVEFKLLAF